MHWHPSYGGDIEDIHREWSRVWKGIQQVVSENKGHPMAKHSLFVMLDLDYAPIFAFNWTGFGAFFLVTSVRRLVISEELGTYIL